MNLPLNDLALTLLCVNAFAVLALLLSGRRRATRPTAPEGRRGPETSPESGQEPAQPIAPLAIEAALRFGTPGEARLARDVERWRRRAARGENRPRAAGTCRVGGSAG